MKSKQMGMGCSTYNKDIDWKVKTTARIISVVFFVAILVCSICDYVITGNLSWSLYPISSIVFTWILLFPLLYMDKKQILLSLSLLSSLIIPYLFTLYKIMGSPDLFMEIGIGAAVSTVFFLWIIYFLFIKVVKSLAISISLLLAIPVSLIINLIVGYYTNAPGIDIVDISIDIALVIASALNLIFENRSKLITFKD